MEAIEKIDIITINPPEFNIDFNEFVDIFPNGIYFILLLFLDVSFYYKSFELNMKQIIDQQEKKIKKIGKDVEKKLMELYNTVNFNYKPPKVNPEENFNNIMEAINRETEIIKTESINQFNEIIKKVKSFDSVINDVPAKIKFEDLKCRINYYYII